MAAWRSSKSRTARSKRKREGAAAVEFAMVAIPFFLMIFSILELGVVFVLDSVLETAAMESGRLIRTGQANEQNFDKDKFKTQVCNKMVVFKSDCASRMTVDVRVIPKFSAPNAPDPVTNNAMDPNKTIYNGGQAGSLILVRVWYTHPLVTPLLSQAVSRVGPGKVLLSATTAFRNEPWQS